MERASLFWSGWHRAPMLRFALPFAAGLAIASLLTLSSEVCIILGALALLLVAVQAFIAFPFRHRWLPYAASMPAMLIAGMCWWVVSTSDTRPPREATGAHLVEVDVVHGASARHVRCDARLLRSWSTDGVHATNAMAMLTLAKDSLAPRLRPGDVLLVHADLGPHTRTPDPGGFDVRAWLAARGIHDQAFVADDHWRMLDHRWRWTDLFLPAQERVWEWLARSGLRDREKAVVLALLLGIRNELDADQKDAFARSGTMHVLAVSGMHVALIYWVLMVLLKPLGGGVGARWARALIAFLVLWGYAGITSATPSVLRATVMCSLFVVAGLMGRRSATLNTLAGSALLLLVWDPRMLFQLSFQLSFLAVLGIVLCYDPIRRLWSPANILVRYCWSLISVSLAAQLFTTPLSLAVFNAFPVWFLPANIIIVTLVNIGVVGGMLLLVTLQVPVLGPFVADALGGLVWLLGQAGRFFADAPFAYPDVRVTSAQSALIMVIILAIGLDRLGGLRAGRWLAWATLPVLAFSIARQVVLSTSQRQLVVFDERAGLVMALREGPSAVVVESAPGLANARQRVERFTRASGAMVVDTLSTSELRATVPVRSAFSAGGAGAWFGAGMGVLLVDADPPPPGGPAFDALVFIAEPQQAAEAAFMRLRPGGHVVLAGMLDGLERWRLRKRCAELGLACHDVRRDGAFVHPVGRSD